MACEEHDIDPVWWLAQELIYALMDQPAKTEQTDKTAQALSEHLSASYGCPKCGRF
jgi:hypothetical protein